MATFPRKSTGAAAAAVAARTAPRSASRALRKPRTSANGCASPQSLRTAWPRGNVKPMRLAVLLLLVTAACGHERATILAFRVTSGQANAPEPVKGADGALECPGQMLPQDLGESDPDGILRAQH